jgi:hypothetical protein
MPSTRRVDFNTCYKELNHLIKSNSNIDRSNNQKYGYIKFYNNIQSCNRNSDTQTILIITNTCFSANNFFKKLKINEFGKVIIEDNKLVLQNFNDKDCKQLVNSINLDLNKCSMQGVDFFMRPSI